MSVMRDYRPKGPSKKDLPSTTVVGWLTLISMGMALGFVFGYGLLYTGV